MEGCPTDDVYYDALRAAEKRLSDVSDAVETLFGMDETNPSSVLDLWGVKMFLKEGDTAKECAQALLPGEASCKSFVCGYARSCKGILAKSKPCRFSIQLC